MTTLRSLSAIVFSISLLGGCASQQQADTKREWLQQELQSLSSRVNQEAKRMDMQYQASSHSLQSKDRVAVKTRSNFSCAYSPKTAIEKRPPVVSLSFLEADLRDALIELSVMTNIPIVMDDMVQGLVSANFNEVPLDKALNILLATGEFSYRLFDDYVLVGSSSPEAPSFANLAITCRYKPYHILPIDLAGSLTPYFQQFVRVPQHADYLTITAPLKIQNSIQSRLRTFDEAPDQVLLEMSIVEVSREAMDIMGVNWSRFGKDPNTQMMRQMGAGEWTKTEAMQSTSLIDAFTIGLLPHRTLADSIQFLQKNGEANIKAMPSIVSLDGREALFSTKHTAWVPETLDSYKARELVYGVEMNVIPRIANNGQITLNIVNASVSDLTQGEKGHQQIVSHTISNTVSIRDGDYLVLGGLLQKKIRSKDNGIPGLKNSKSAGWLFGQDQVEYQETEVLIMIRPQILARETRGHS